LLGVVAETADAFAGKLRLNPPPVLDPEVIPENE